MWELSLTSNINKIYNNDYNHVYTYKRRKTALYKYYNTKGLIFFLNWLYKKILCYELLLTGKLHLSTKNNKSECEDFEKKNNGNRKKITKWHELFC